MELKTFRAASMHEALQWVRRELGPEAAVLHTREVRQRRLFGLLPGERYFEVTASTEVNVPSRLPSRREPSESHQPPTADLPAFAPEPPAPPMRPVPPPESARPDVVQEQLAHLQKMVQQLCHRSDGSSQRELPEELFRLFTELLDADLDENLARELVERVRAELPRDELAEPMLLKARIARLIEDDIRVSGPIAAASARRRVVALVGPTGVGKTTTIAKLAANYRLKERRRVGLITVDTYRIAAVEQLRTYADIIDLPMQVVSTPREMREAVRQMAELDLILMDTAGRSPRDEIKLQELKAFLAEADVDEVHLVLSAVSSGRLLQQTAEQFAAVGTTSLLLTKLDEASALGNVLPLIRSSKLPLSYLTDGQNVPDDIQVAEPRSLARMILAMDERK